MLDIQYIREHAEEIKANCVKRRNKVDIDRLIAVDETRRQLLGEVEALRASRKSGSKGKPTEEEIAKMRSLGDEIKTKVEALATVEVEFSDLMIQVPNLTHPDSPIGGVEDFTVVYQKDHAGFDFTPKDHEEILTSLDLIDFERVPKWRPQTFYFAKNDLARLNQALLNYGIDVVTKHGFTFMETPDLACNSVLQGVGFNPRGNETQIYSVENTDLSLIGTGRNYRGWVSCR